MAATLTVVNLNGQTLARYTLQTGNAQSIAAMDNVHYQLADAQSVEAGRAGDDLVVRIQGEPALIIEDYFLLDDSGLKNPLLGLNEYGQYVAYPLVDTSALPLEHLLAEEVIASSAGAAINPAIALAAIGGVALTGAAIAGNRKDSRKADNDAPNQPQTPFDPNPPSPPADNGNTTPPPSGDGNTPLPPSGGGNQPPPRLGNHLPSGSVTISGNPEVGQTLTASHSLKDDDGLGPITFKWFANGAEVGQGERYTIQAQDKGKPLTVKAEYTDGKGAQESVQSAATAPVTDSVAPPIASELSVANAQTVIEGDALEYTVTLNAPSRAGQVLKLETLVHNSRVPHDQLSKTADLFAPGEYLANGTVFTRDVKNIAVTPLSNSAAISKHLLRLAQYGPKYYEDAELMKKLEALDRGENVDIPGTGNGAHIGALTALNTDAYNIPIYIVDSTDPNQTYAEFSSTDPRVLEQSRFNSLHTQLI